MEERIWITWWIKFYIKYSRFSIYIKKHGEKIVNLSIRIFVNKIKNKITFKIKTGYYLEILNLETIILLGSNKSKITKKENGENVPQLEITDISPL